MIAYNSHRINENDMTVFFTINGYEWHGDFPIMPEADIQAHLEANEDRLMCGVYRKQYQEADVKENTKEKWDEWIAAGCENTITYIDDKGKEKIKKVEVEKRDWVSTHPKPDLLEEKVKRLETEINVLKAQLK